MYCACPHLSKECAERIARKEEVPKKCVNCRYDHNANSPLCMYYPKDRKKKNVPAKQHPEILTTAPAPQLADEKEFPSFPGRTVPKPRRGHAPGGTGAPRGGTPAPKLHQKAHTSTVVPGGDGTAVASIGRTVPQPRRGHAPGVEHLHRRCPKKPTPLQKSQEATIPPPLGLRLPCKMPHLQRKSQGDTGYLLSLKKSLCPRAFLQIPVRQESLPQPLPQPIKTPKLIC